MLKTTTGVGKVHSSTPLILNALNESRFLSGCKGQNKGPSYALESAHQKAIHIVGTHHPKPLPQGAERALSNIGY